MRVEGVVFHLRRSQLLIVGVCARNVALSGSTNDRGQLTMPREACTLELGLTPTDCQTPHLIEFFSAAGPTFLGTLSSIQVTHGILSRRIARNTYVGVTVVLLSPAQERVP